VATKLAASKPAAVERPDQVVPETPTARKLAAEPALGPTTPVPVPTPAPVPAPAPAPTQPVEAVTPPVGLPESPPATDDRAPQP